MSNKKEKKLPDKLMGNYREYLDLDTDEEEFERQESPEVEEELPAEPEKPIFSEDDLMTLVKYIKDLTIHMNCDNMSWCQQSDNIIQEYFTTPSHTVLCTFHEQNELNAILNIPTHVSSGFTYFVRSPWQVYTPENFYSTALFGTVNKNVKDTVLKFMESIYAPIILHSDEYATFLTNDIFLNVHNFIMHLMEDIYKTRGLTMLYVPKERLQTFPKSWNKNDYFLLGRNEITALSDDDEKKQKLVYRLEKIVWFWIKQIREATRIPLIRENIKNLQDEFDYWKAKFTNLNYLRGQLSNTEVRLIVNILKNLNSMSTSKLEKLIMDIDVGLQESSANLIYLNILLDSCKTFNVPEDVEDSVTEVLLLILFIWAESPFYNTTNNMGILCQALSSQIIHQCKEYIKLNTIFRNNAETGIQILKKCIRCCSIYEAIYDNVTTNVLPYITPDKKWNINKQEIFLTIHTFRQRCCDVIEICQAQIVFRRNNKTGLIGGPRGTNYEAYWEYIESLFNDSSNNITMREEIIFDISKFTWRKKMIQFKCTILQLENMIVNLINDIFENITNIEEGVEAIYALQIFKKRGKLQELLHTKWIQIWHIFSNEIKHCYISTIFESKKRTGMNDNLICRSQYLRYQHSIITKASEWISKCGAEKYALQQYEYVIDLIDNRKKKDFTFPAQTEYKVLYRN